MESEQTRVYSLRIPRPSPQKVRRSVSEKINFMRQFMSIYNAVKFKLKASIFDIQGDLVRN